MREILFRGKRIDNGEWAFGNLLIQETDNSEVNFISNNETVVDVFIQPIKKVWDTHWNSFGRQEWKAVSPMLKVDPASIGQYTGLMDKNGKRIFEGDIVHIWVDYDDDEPIKKYRAIVEFGNPNHEYNWGYQLKMIDTMSHNEDILLWVEMEDGGAFCEVIGNIHDNPERMKEK